MAEHTLQETVADTDVKVTGAHVSHMILLFAFAWRALPMGQATHSSPCSSYPALHRQDSSRVRPAEDQLFAWHARHVTSCVLLHSEATCWFAPQLMLQFTHARLAHLSVLVAL
jgi:hypothetical protein